MSKAEAKSPTELAEEMTIPEALEGLVDDDNEVIADAAENLLAAYREDDSEGESS